MSRGLLAHRSDGRGDPVVLLNGGMMTYPGWQPLVTVLARDFRVVRCDFRGQLLSPGRAPTTLADHAKDVVRLLDHLEVGSAHLVGTSFGALVGVRLAADHPERARSLVAIAAAARATPEMAESGRRLRQLASKAAAGGDRREFQDLLVEDVYSAAFREAQAEELASRRGILGRLPASWFEGLDGILESVDAFDVLSAARRVECPSLAVGAAGDAIMPREGVRELAAALRAELVEHPTAGHGIVVEDLPWLAEHCHRFLLGTRQPTPD